MDFSSMPNVLGSFRGSFLNLALTISTRNSSSCVLSGIISFLAGFGCAFTATLVAISIKSYYFIVSPYILRETKVINRGSCIVSENVPLFESIHDI